MQILLLFGVILILGLAGGRLFEKIGIPQVVGYIIVGLILGESITHVVPGKLLDNLSPLTSIALAFIGFMVGGELNIATFRKYGGQFFTILFSEGMLAMILVSVFVTLWTRNIALGILLGALSSATAPAATVDVLWEYRSRGPLTNTILAIVALDDGLALILYGFAFAFSKAIVGRETLNLQNMLSQPLLEIFGSVAIGIALGFLADKSLQWIKSKEDKLVIIIGTVLLASGAAAMLQLSLILTSMVLGFYLTNINPHRNESNFEIIKAFVPPIYIIFFVFIGARLNLGLLPKMGIIGALYIVGRTAGKWIGAFGGAKLSHSPDTVRKYLGFALFSQAGVAIGLALDTYQNFRHYGAAGNQIGNTIINVIAATTFIVQIIGPPSVKYAISRAGEISPQSKLSEVKNGDHRF
jgi:Kef-type K+ transport system membrane component KefB